MSVMKGDRVKFDFNRTPTFGDICMHQLYTAIYPLTGALHHLHNMILYTATSSLPTVNFPHRRN